MSRQSSSEQQPRRVKVTLACIVCRKKKVKCDGVQPSCSRCKNSGTHCEYSDRPRKRGPPKGYVEVIENRAHRIETLLGNKKIDPRYVSSSPPTAAIASPTTTAPASSSSCANEIQKLVADAVCTVEVKLSSIQASLPGSQGSVCDSSPVEIDDWCDKFFKHFNVLFPILSKPHFMHQIEQDQIDPRLRCAVYAVGCRYANPREQSGKIWFDKCLDMLSSCSHDSILTVQALAIICWYAYLIGDLQKCCALQQKLAQAVQNANLAQESAGHIVDQEMARRAFWVSVVIDQWLAVCTGHRFLTCKANVKQPHLEDSQLSAIDSRKLQLHQQSSPPKHEDDLSVESALQVAAFSEMIKLSNIVGQAHYAAADSSLETALTAWLLSLPPYLEYGSKSSTDGSPPSAVARIFHILYYTVQILLHRDRHSDPFSSICTTAANTIVHISEQMLHDSQDRYLHNVFGLALTLASSIHLRDARASKNTHNSLPAEINLGKSLRILKDANCTVLLQVDFDRLLHRFLVGRCGIVIDGHHDNASSQHHHAPTRTVTNNMKRPCVVDDLERAVKRPSFDFSRWLPPEMMQETQRLSTPAHHEAPSMSTGIETTTTTTTTTAAAAVAATSSPALCMADLLAEPCYWLQHEFQPSPHSPSITTTGALTNSPEISTPAGSSYHSSLDLFPKEFDNVYTFCAPDLLNEFI